MKKQIQLLLAIAFIAAMGEVSITNAQGWTQIGNDIDGEAANDYSGSPVTLSSDGNILAVGASLNDGTASNAGHVRIYELSGSTWVQKGIDIDGEAMDNNSGKSVSLSSDGNTVAIGAIGNSGNGTYSGHVRIYEWSGSAWMQKGIDIDGEAANNQSGISVSLSVDGNTLAIGAYLNSGNGGSAGHVRIYEWSGSDWTQKGIDIDGEAAGDNSGWSVSLSSDGNVIAIGAHNNDGYGSNAGHVRIYEWSGTAWTQKGMDIDGEAAGDLSGSSVNISADGNIVAVGAYANSGNGSFAGHVRVYEWNALAWIQKGADIDAEAAGDFCGASVNLSADGNTLAIGAPNNNGNGYSSGHVRIYDWNGSAWTQNGMDIDGEAANDKAGWSVSLSASGNVVAIGASNNNNANGLKAGHVRVYSDTTSVGIEPNDFENNIRVSPNPSKGLFLIDLGREYKNVSITVKNALGQVVFTKNFSILKSTPLKLQDESGIYFLEINADNNQRAIVKIEKL